MKTPYTMLFAALVLAGCASTPPSAPALPDVPAAFREATPVQTPVASKQAWWQAFADPQLDALVQRAESGNTSLQAAAARLASARALLGRAEADRLPQVGIGAGAVRERSPQTGYRPATTISLGANLSYELDIAGRLTKARDAAALDAAEREALLRDTRLLVQGEVARSYFALRAIDAERALVQGTVASYRNTLTLTERRFAAGDLPELEVARVRSELAANESEALALERQRSQVEHALALLIGEAPSRFTLTAAEWTPALPQVPAGVPSAVLARRPDIAAAQQALLAAQARVGIAQAAWWPNLSLTANGGQASPELSDLLKSGARTWGVGALLALPVFDGGARKAGVARAEAELTGASVRLREQVLVALRDVEDELAATRLLADQAEAQGRAVDAAARVSTLAESRYRNGFVSQLELLDAQRSELRSRRQALQVRAARMQATVGLMRALGGAWQV